MSFVDWLYEQESHLAWFVFTRVASKSMWLNGRGTKAVGLALFSYRKHCRDEGLDIELERVQRAMDELILVKEQWKEMQTCTS